VERVGGGQNIFFWIWDLKIAKDYSTCDGILILIFINIMCSHKS
jgi:hypothetical protein